MSKDMELEKFYMIQRGDDGEPRVIVKDDALKGKSVDFANVNAEGELYVLLKDAE